MPQAYDIAVIGAGMGGYVAAIRAAQLGQRVAVVERQPALGGTCLLWGCIPTKALLEHAHAFKLIKAATEWGVMLPFGAPAIDMDQVQDRKDKIVGGLSKGVEFLLKKNKIDWIKGTATLAGEGRITVAADGTSQELTAKEIIVATGSAPRSVPGVTIDHTRIITSDEAIGLRKVPASIVILGSGAVGVEFASIYRRFGSDVTIVELLPRLVPGEDEAVSAQLEKSFKKQGITVDDGHQGDGCRRVGRRRDAHPGRVRRAGADLAGRTAPGGHRPRPRHHGTGIEALNVTMDRGYIKVDELYRTSVPHISAIGDVVTVGGKGAHPQLAHLSSMEGIIVAERLAGKDVKPINFDHVPGCTYCDPEIGSVGLTEAEARSKGYDVTVGTFPFGYWAAPGWRAKPKAS